MLLIANFDKSFFDKFLVIIIFFENSLLVEFILFLKLMISLLFNETTSDIFFIM